LTATFFRVRKSSCFTLIKSVLAVTQDLLHAKGLAMRVKISALPEYLLGDSNRLGQVLVNYLGNAVKFTEKGSITLCGTVEEETEHDLLIRFEVADTGIGMSAEQQRRLFHSFEQADNSTTREFGGTGLGLAINKRLAEAMGGAVGVDSQLGLGSQFWFTARLGKGKKAVATVIQATEDLAEGELKQHYRGARLLLAEDDPINQEVALGMLRELGFVVDLAENGARAVELAAAGNYAVILMDMQMPELDGVEATKRIRALPKGKTIPVIAMTANAFAEDKERCFAAGMNDFVAKPVIPGHLFATLLKWMPAGAKKGVGLIAAQADGDTAVSADMRSNPIAALASIPGLEMEVGLRTVRNKLPTYVHLLQLFVQSHPHDHELIRAALQAQQLEEAQRLAHTLKGAAGTLGATRIQQLAAAVELPLKQKLPTASADAEKALEDLDLALPDLVAALDSAFSAAAAC
jgi:two-component system sensor histidine kinase/response regulator